MPVVNVAITDSFILRDNSNVAITGKVSGDFSVVEAYDIATPGTTAAVTLTEIASGKYRISFVPTTTESWASHVVYNTGGVFREFDERYEVQTAAQADPAGALNGNTVVISGPATASGDFRITQGNVYSIANGNPLTWTLTDAPDLTGETVTFYATGTSLEITCTVTGAGTSSQVVKAELTSDQTDALALTVRKYRLRATLADVDLAKGALIIQPAT